jgi:hypothetical protein
MSLLSDIVRIMVRSSHRIITIQNVAEREVYKLFSQMRRELEGQLHDYLDMYDYANVAQTDRVLLAGSFPFRSILGQMADAYAGEFRRLEQNNMYRVQDAMGGFFGDLENVFWQKDSHIQPKGWVQDVLRSMNWDRLSAYMTYLGNGAEKWLGVWGNEAPAQLGAGLMGGEPVSTIVSRITGVNVNTPDNRVALGKKVFDGLAVNTRWAVIKTADEARTEGYNRLNEQYGLELSRIWVAKIDTRTCPLCLRLHGTVVGVNEEFPWRKSDKPQPYLGVLPGPPRHPNCRCGVAPWKASWEEYGLATFTPESLHQDALAELRRRGL